MKILVTGGTGFVGQFLIPKLRALGHQVHQMEQYFFKNAGELKYKRNVHVADITDFMAVHAIIEEVKPEVVVHLAAMTSVAHSYKHPLETTLINYFGTVVVAEATRLVCPDIKQFIYPSSAEVYGVNHIFLKREVDPLTPNSPYAIAKRASEDYLRYMYLAYRRPIVYHNLLRKIAEYVSGRIRGYKHDESAFPTTVVRPFNSYGREDSNFFVVERTISQMLTSNVCKLGDKVPVRDFLHIDDHVNAYLAVLNNKRAFGETYNLSTGIGVTIEELVGIIRDLIGFTGTVEWGTIERRPLDIMHLIGDNTKLLDLGWKRPRPLEEGLQLTVDFWRNKLNA